MSQVFFLYFILLQYPDWLKEHGSEVSPDDLQRYSKQLEIMSTICGEFERQPEGGQTTQDSSDKIMQLMQQVCVLICAQLSHSLGLYLCHKN